MKIIIPIFILVFIIKSNNCYNLNYGLKSNAAGADFNENEMTDDDDADWSTFKSKFTKSFNSNSDESNRKALFIERKRNILRHNKLNKGFKLKLNAFSDISDEEMMSAKMGLLFAASVPAKSTTTATERAAKAKSVPPTLDYTKNGFVTPVKDQGMCGSCWSFATTGALEGQYAKKHGKQMVFSEQHLIDCSSNYGNLGCNGGKYTFGYNFIKASSGIYDSTQYPYKGAQGNCRTNVKGLNANIRGYVALTPNNETLLMQALAGVGPIAIAVDSSKSSFWYYASGVYYEPTCSSTQLTHAMLLVGYGTENGEDYWLVKNSWGTSWGLKGYIKMARNRNNHCGIATFAVYPVLA